MAVDFGSDIAWDVASGDLDPKLSMASGTAALVQSICRRFLTRRGSLAWARRAGLDLRLLVGKKIAPAEVWPLQAAIAAEAKKDERVKSATATVAFDAAGQVLAITLALDTAAGPFRLVFAPSAAGLAILRVEQGR